MRALFIAVLMLVVSAAKGQRRDFGNYVPQYDATQYGQMLREHKQAYERNVEKIQNRIYDIGDMITDLNKVNHTAAVEANNTLKSVIRWMNESNLDYAEFNNYMRVTNKLKKLERYIENSYE